MKMSYRNNLINKYKIKTSLRSYIKQKKIFFPFLKECQMLRLRIFAFHLNFTNCAVFKIRTIIIHASFKKSIRPFK